MRAEPRRIGLWIERGLLATGIFSLIRWGVVVLNASLHQHTQRAVLERTRGEAYPPNSRFEVLNTGSLVGSIDIPRLGLSAVIAEGDDEATLRVAVGHLPDTPLPGMRVTALWLDIGTLFFIVRAGRPISGTPEVKTGG